MAYVWSTLTTKWSVNLVDCEPRTADVDSIGHHHTAGTSELAALQLMRPGGKTVTPNYLITPYDIIGIVPENYRAYTSSDKNADNRSITYEILNSTAGPDWRFDPRTLANVARLDADVSRRYKVLKRHAIPGYWEHRNLWEWYKRSYPTACAGPSFHINAIIAASAAVDTNPPKEGDMATQYPTRFDYRKSITLEPTKSTRLQLPSGADMDITASGDKGRAVVTAHVYAKAEPGESVDIKFVWYDIKAARGSDHFVERATADKFGTINANVTFQRPKPVGTRIYLQVQGPSSNTQPAIISTLAADACLLN